MQYIKITYGLSEILKKMNVYMSLIFSHLEEEIKTYLSCLLLGFLDFNLFLVCSEAERKLSASQDAHNMRNMHEEQMCH